MNPLALKLAAAGTALALAVAGGFGVAWRLQANNVTTLALTHAKQISASNDALAKLKLEHANDRIASQRAARVVSEKRIATQRSAETHAVAATQRAVVDRGQLAAVGSGLRLATADAVRAADGDLAACTQQVRTLRVISDECSVEYESMAGHAQEWYVEAVKQNEAAQ